MLQKYALPQNGGLVPHTGSNNYTLPRLQDQQKEEYAYQPYIFKNRKPTQNGATIPASRFSRFVSGMWAMLVFLLYALLLIMPLFFLLSAFRYLAQ